MSSTTDDVSKRMRLIIADDQILMLDVVKRLLATDYNVIASVDRGDSAFEAITRMEPDIAVLDVSMPDVSGIEVARRLQANGSTTKIVFLTVHEDPEFVREAIAAGAIGYVIKSCLASDLREALKRAAEGNLFISSCIRMAG